MSTITCKPHNSDDLNQCLHSLSGSHGVPDMFKFVSSGLLLYM